MVHDFCFEKEVEKGKIYKIKRKEMTKGGSSLNLVGLERYGSRYLSYISTYWFADLKYWRNIEGEENEAIKIIHERLPRSILDSFFFSIFEWKKFTPPLSNFFSPSIEEGKKEENFEREWKVSPSNTLRVWKQKRGERSKKGPLLAAT